MNWLAEDGILVSDAAGGENVWRAVGPIRDEGNAAALTRTALEHAVELEPRYADAWACLAVLYLDEDRHEFNRRPDALDRALEAARRAVDADPANQLANYALAQAYYYRRDLGAFRPAAERAIQ